MGTIVLYVIAGGAVLLSLGWVYGERGRLLQSSTWTAMKEFGLKNMLNFKGIHAYIYGRWTNGYVYILRNIIFPNSNEDGRRKWTDRYHGKVITHDQARAVITLNRSIPLRDLEQVIPYPTARNLVLNGPPDVVVHDCACRKTLAGHCEPAQVCLVIGKPFTDFIIEHKPNSRRLTQAEALELLRQEHERGHMHSAWFKDAIFNRFYSICNCCKCCCGGIEIMTKYGSRILSSSGYVAAVDQAKCEACGKCEKICPFNAVTVNETSKVHWENCMGCGACTSQCSTGAISLVRDEKKGLPFDVRLIS